MRTFFLTVNFVPFEAVKVGKTVMKPKICPPEENARRMKWRDEAGALRASFVADFVSAKNFRRILFSTGYFSADLFSAGRRAEFLHRNVTRPDRTPGIFRVD